MLRSLLERALRRVRRPRVPAHGRLHLGCGRRPLEGWMNLDRAMLPGVDVVADLDDCRRTPLPFAANSFREFLGLHVLEHLRDPLAFMQELHRIAQPGARAEFHLPFGSSDDAFEDPTHVRQYFANSFMYFAQPTYYRADYGYLGDWQPETVRLLMPASRYAGKDTAELLEEVRTTRNCVREMRVQLRAVKPARKAGVDAGAPAQVTVKLV